MLLKFGLLNACHIQCFLFVASNQPASAIEVDFLDMLEKEEEDFANQIRKQKSFLQNVFREKEELAQLCVNQTAKLSKLESERMEWQRKIIQTEREKRDHLEKLDKEKQDHQQSLKQFEKVFYLVCLLVSTICCNHTYATRAGGLINIILLAGKKRLG